MEAPGKVYTPGEYKEHFNSEAYLKDFYSNIEYEPAMKIVMYFLPSLIGRLREGCRVLDVGSGPTIHVALACRKKASEVYLSDYLEQNRSQLVQWMNAQSTFNWHSACRLLAQTEGDPFAWKTMEDEARRKLKGVLACDIHASRMLELTDAQKELDIEFDAVTTFFCTEYACETMEQYFNAIANMCKHIRVGGHLLMGGILEETWCQFGGKKFSCLYVTENDLIRALTMGGIDTDEMQFYFHEGIFVLLGKKAKVDTEDIQN